MEKKNLQSVCTFFKIKLEQKHFLLQICWNIFCRLKNIYFIRKKMVIKIKSKKTEFFKRKNWKKEGKIIFSHISEHYASFGKEKFDHFWRDGVCKLLPRTGPTFVCFIQVYYLYIFSRLDIGYFKTFNLSWILNYLIVLDTWMSAYEVPYIYIWTRFFYMFDTGFKLIRCK